ncbi:CPXCG motif-containing cysteine-rich protein [Lysobacter sp. LF1]|uniref:CPXCG motif-containing cysteine-rich protein n=1 Tax=Lysobacter stagni TaxID=3045172 RepID=A0ABT6XEQ9_9GAMM|nr:CPXCG motif-containing cysteine-rich protein [Lysobacter sp. LF1]MDI9238629.1 CPXCG motif-containing cysteine-rich protein [Lysobacter sp. LF1]
MLPTSDVQCPYCGETITLLVDTSVGAQQYIEDCQVCCRPIIVSVRVDEEGEPWVDVAAEDDA